MLLYAAGKQGGNIFGVENAPTDLPQSSEMAGPGISTNKKPKNAHWPKIPRKYPEKLPKKNTKNGHFGYLGVVFPVLSGYFGGIFLGSPKMSDVWRFLRNPEFPKNFPAHSDFKILGSPFSLFWWEARLMLGYIDP